MKKRKGILATLAILGAFLLWAVIGRQSAAEAVYPVENGTNWFVCHVFRPIGAALTRPRLAAENRRLLDEIAQLKMQLADHAELAGENGLPGTDLGHALGMFAGQHAHAGAHAGIENQGFHV